MKSVIRLIAIASLFLAGICAEAVAATSASGTLDNGPSPWPNPSSTSSGTGSAVVTLNPDTNSFSATLNAQNLNGVLASVTLARVSNDGSVLIITGALGVTFNPDMSATVSQDTSYTTFWSNDYLSQYLTVQAAQTQFEQDIKAQQVY